MIAAFTVGPTVTAAASYELVGFDELRGWSDDDHGAALRVFLETCPDMIAPEWAKICAVATQTPDPKSFFEAFFQPVLISDGKPMLFTGYFEPELRGSRVQSAEYRYPVYALPSDTSKGRYASRRAIEEQGLLSGQGLELAWVKDPVDAFFLQIQGSGRIVFPDGSKLRLGYAGKNGHEYRSIGRELVRRGTFEAHEVSADVIRSWVARNGEAGRELLWHNPSFVFFREVNDVSPSKGPLGAMNRSVTAMRSIAVDPVFTPLGAPVWIEKSGNDALERLMIAQDTGSAIKGAQRADIFYGTGRVAGRTAGQIKDSGRMVTLLPRQLAFALFAGKDQ
ncbi:MAG: murein transglycosylase A [Pseudomonadota bacterium]